MRRTSQVAPKHEIQSDAAPFDWFSLQFCLFYFSTSPKYRGVFQSADCECPRQNGLQGYGYHERHPHRFLRQRGASGSGGNSGANTQTYNVGGSISGLLSNVSVGLQINGANGLTASANGAYTFGSLQATGTAYSVTVATQPAGQSCTVSNGNGTIGTSAVVNVDISCRTHTAFGFTYLGQTMSEFIVSPHSRRLASQDKTYFARLASQLR